MRLVWFVSFLALVGCNKSGKLEVIADEKGFHPSYLEFKKGAPAKVTFTRTSDATCAKEVVFKELDIKKDLPLNTPVVLEIPTDQERTLTFTCGMGMYESRLIIQ